MKSSDFRKQINSTLSELDSTVSDLQSGYDETVRVRKVVENTKEILDDLDMQFCQKTGLQGNDIAFLFAAVGLQLLRITIINELTKIEPAGKKNKLENGLHDFQDKIMDKLSNIDSTISTINRPYYASTNQIMSTHKVPYDAQETLTARSLDKLVNKNRPMDWDFDLDGYINEMNLPLFKGGNHRFSTIAHDPLIGLVFGTANIMTNTITCVKQPKNGLSFPVLTTNHVIYTTNYTHPVIGVYGSTTVMLCEMVNRILGDPIAFVAALIKQIIHIGTDMFTPCGIQLPAENLLLSNTNVERITKYVGWGDIIKIGTSAKIAELINTIISTLHTLTHNYNDGVSTEMFNVRTRKIILYSNAIATGSNVIWVGTNIVAGDKTQLKNLDFGGLLVLLKRLKSDTEYINRIKEEFIFGSYKDMIIGDSIV